VAEAIELAPDERITVCTPYAADALLALTEAAPRASVAVVTYDLRTAEAAEGARAALAPELRERTTVHVGDGPAAGPTGPAQPVGPDVGGGWAASSGPAGPQVVLLWPSGWEGHARIRAQVVEALSLLPVGGRLYLLATRQKGGVALLEMLRKVCGAAELAAKGPGGLRLLSAVKRPDVELAEGERGAADEAAEHAGQSSRGGVLLVEADVLGRHFVFRTAPGVFSHLMLNAGTRFFLEALEAREHETLAGCRTILDLGCGYGPLGIALAAVHPQAAVVLADVDSRAVRLAAENAELNGLAGRVESRLSDGLRHLPGMTFDAIVSHFPLHVPREEQTRLLREARDALNPGGQLYLCALAAYDLRPVLRAVFGNARVVAEGNTANGDRYRVVAASKSGAAHAAASPLPVARSLLLVQLGVGAAELPQLGVGALLLDAAVLQHHDAVGHAHGAEAVRDQHGRAALGELAEAQVDVVLGLRVE
jgi:16S rRNA (guanine1207-N2)-methyltransferase